MNGDDVLDSLLEAAISEYERNKDVTIKTLTTQQSIFDLFVAKCLSHHAQPAHTLAEMRQTQSTKSKGDLFERFCARYLRTIKGYKKVWLLKDLPGDVKTQLKLPMNKADYGIDIVCRKDDSYAAVQCKFKAPSKPKTISFHKSDGTGGARTIYPCVGWKELTTFNELCNASGPWSERITCTTAPSVRRLGGIKNEQDKSICCGTFRGLSIESWKQMRLGRTTLREESATSSTTSTSTTRPTREELRAKRLLFFDKGGKEEDGKVEREDIGAKRRRCETETEQHAQ